MNNNTTKKNIGILKIADKRSVYIPMLYKIGINYACYLKALCLFLRGY